LPIFLNNRHPRTRLAKVPLVELAEWVLAGEDRRGELSITLVDDPTIAQLNAAYHHRKGPTDVLSFSLEEGGEEVWGDIYISLDTARQQAAEYGHTLTEEVHLLVVHGVLHLCGFDDQEEPHRREMRAREAKYLEWPSPS
jgi:probable rRNA maturation factor